MSLHNLNNQHLSMAQMEAVQDALAQLETAMADINVNLTPEDRKKYGRVHEQNKLFVNKVHDYSQSQPALSSPDVDWKEFAADYDSRQACEAFIDRLDNLSQRLQNAKILHDYDNYQDALSDYAYATYKAGSATPGFEEKYQDLKEFFAKRSRKHHSDAAPTTSIPDVHKD
jgi:protein subunit release factor A